MSGLGEIVFQVGQAAVDMASEVVIKKYGWFGCLGFFIALAAAIAVTIWAF